MDKLSIHLREDKTAFAPLQVVQGMIRWFLASYPRSLELSLFWYTMGKGTRDVGVVETLTFHNPGAFDSKDFTFTLPEGPYSFSGKLISLLWALELVVEHPRETARLELTVSPTGREVLLYGDGEAPDDDAGAR